VKITTEILLNFGEWLWIHPVRKSVFDRRFMRNCHAGQSLFVTKQRNLNLMKMVEKEE